MPDDSTGEKTIPATPHKRDQQRREGNIAKSQDLNSGWALGVALLAMVILGPAMFATLLDAGRYFFGHLDELLLENTPLELLARRVLYFLAIAVGPFMVAMLLAGLTMNFAQVGFLLTGKPLVPKLNRLNPISGFRKFVSMRALMELVKSLLKLSIVGAIAWLTVRNHVHEIISFMQLSPVELVRAVAWIIFTLWWRIVVAMILIGLLDYAFQRWQHEQEIKMTDREFREETKQMEGDPQIKRRVRQLQRQMAMQRMMAEVPEADVVITNPVTYAVALRYDMASMDAPRVVAKGMRLTAQRIRDIAQEHRVPVIERPELARALYRSVEVGQPIPGDLFRAVAEVLSFVYRIDQRAEKQRERADSMLNPDRVAV